MIDADTRLLCLLGDPVSQSQSPLLHNSLIRKYGLNLAYLALRTRNLGKAIEGLKAVNFLGANITLPFKTDVLKFLDVIEKDASLAGAVNTIMNRNGRIHGFNTDIFAIKKTLDAKNKRILILGTGGAARAACVALRKNEIVILGRNRKKAEALARDFGCESRTSRHLKDAVKKSDLIINATPVGMFPRKDASPLQKKILQKNHIVFDMVYNPPKTKLLKDTESVGAKAVCGVEMFCHQALKSFQIWTGILPDVSFARGVIS